MATLNGIDVSSWQPGNICTLVNYDFAIIKATEGTAFVSSTCNQQCNDVIKRGKLLGLYHFARQYPAATEAAFFVKNIKGYIGKAMLILDYEDDALKNGREWVRAFIREVKRLTGVPCGVYASGSPAVAQRIPELCKDENVLFWCANYPLGYQTMGYRTDLKPYTTCGIFQYTSNGRLAGYGSDLDLNVFFGDAAAFKKYYGGTMTVTPPSAISPAPAVTAPDTGIKGRGHVQGAGWQGWKKDSVTIGTTGKGLRLEGLNVDTTKAKGGVLRIGAVAYFNKKWTTYKEVKPDTLIGSTGISAAIECLGFKILENTTGKKLQFRLHRASFSWTGWQTVTGDYLPLGSTAQNGRIEAVEFRLV